MRCTQYVFTEYPNTLFKNHIVFTRSIQYSSTHSVFSKRIDSLNIARDQIRSRGLIKPGYLV